MHPCSLLPRPLLLTFLLAVVLREPSARAEDKVTFETHIHPIPATRCLKCHGQYKVRGGLDLRRKFTMMRGGDGGPALVPGKPDDSSLVKRIESDEMPPPAEGKLAPRHRELIRKWV